MTGALVGVDVGTTSVKVLACPVGGGPAVSVFRSLDWSNTRAGTEMEVDVLFEIVADAIGSALDELPADRVARLGITSFAETAVLLGRDGRPASPLLAWHDPRGLAEADELACAGPAGEFARTTGLPVSNLCTAVKVRALSEAGSLNSTVTRVLSVADWLALRMTGEAAFDVSLASRTGWLRLRDRSWDATMRQWSGLEPGSLPAIAQSGSARGTVAAGVADRLTGATVVVAGMDHLVAAVGADAAAPGAVWDSCGTAEAFVRTSEPLADDVVEQAVAAGLTVGWHVVPDQYVVLGALRSGFAFSRLLQLLGVNSASDLAELESQPATLRDPAAPSVVFDDVFADTYSVGGLTSTTTSFDVWSALVAHVVFCGRRLVDEMDRLCGPHTRFVVGGGWTSSRVLVESKAGTHAATGCAQGGLSGAFGAALLAAEATPVLADRRTLAAVVQLP
jgi:sugar (pentulose or hexulose) kinase